MRKILVIEDDTFLLDAYKLKLSVKPNVEIVTASTGMEGIAKAMVELPDVIVLDIVMPKGSGLAVIKELKSQEVTKHIPIVVASNIDQKNVIEHARQLGAVDFFIKSDITIDKLIDKCMKHTGKGDKR